jgi:hypothetical protein
MDLLLFNDRTAVRRSWRAIDEGTVTLDDKLYEQLARGWIAAGELGQAVAPLTRGRASSTGDSFVRLGQCTQRDWSAAENAWITLSARSAMTPRPS